VSRRYRRGSYEPTRLHETHRADQRRGCRVRWRGARGGPRARERPRGARRHRHRRTCPAADRCRPTGAGRGRRGAVRRVHGPGPARAGANGRQGRHHEGRARTARASGCGCRHRRHARPPAQGDDRRRARRREGRVRREADDVHHRRGARHHRRGQAEQPRAAGREPGRQLAAQRDRPGAREVGQARPGHDDSRVLQPQHGGRRLDLPDSPARRR
jgi:hypothetical protein